MFDYSKIDQYKELINGNGREALKLTIFNFRKAYGEHWLKEFQEANPTFSEIVSLAANYNAESAFIRLKQILETTIESELSPGFASLAKSAALTFLDIKQAEVFQLHAELSEVIHRKQF